ncbi:unnamed protein product [marine sediment metagenome]|uniref:Uncharacterized protein n=1 Tax=marine sediment metagenome TaxID=412755 RepID=X0SZZ2_9ZZZZ
MSKTSVKENPSKAKESTYTEEEIQKQKEVVQKHYENEIPFLEKRLAYEELLTKIETQKFDRFAMQMQMAQAMAPPPEAPTPEGMQQEMANVPTQKRTLKKEI